MKKTIKGQILFGYLVLILVPILMTAVTLFYLNGVQKDFRVVTKNRINQTATKDAIVGHYSWLIGLSDTINEGVEFKGSLDPTTCGLGKWLASVSEEDKKDPAIAKAIADLQAPHEHIHKSASALIELSKTNPTAAYDQYITEIKPKVSGIIANINIINTQYKQFEEVGSDLLAARIQNLTWICIGLLLLGVAASTLIGIKIANRTSAPIRAVAKWSQSLAIGDDRIDFNTVDISKIHPENEISVMIRSFTQMAKSIQENVGVVKRVADGDLTAFVDVRSSQDSLGQNLYRMVQSNDLMFAEILDVASTVAASANEIHRASEQLSQSTTEQANSVESLTSSISEVSDLAKGNIERVENARHIFGDIHVDVVESTKKMDVLVAAVEEIRDASDKISVVIKSIEDISFQTNILALNAAIEAARAGTAGKGFAVVADEVRQLALKSSTAADETKDLIQNTIQKTYYGVKVANETSETFQKISGNVDKTIGIMDDVADVSTQQAHAISSVYGSIEQIAYIATTNAASSEESSAASAEMRHSAELLRKQMSKFNLRQRQYGKPYIPPEKQNDAAFIKRANDNYQKALQRGEISERRLLLE